MLPDYNFPSGGDTLPTQAPGYYASAIIGVIVVGLIAYGIGKVIIKRND